MRKNLFLAAAAAVLTLLSSCQKKMAKVDNEFPDGAPCQLSISLGEPGSVATKIAGVVGDADKTISDVQVFVFNMDRVDNKIDAAKHYTGITGSTGTYTGTDAISCTQGQRQIWVLVNSKVNYVDGQTSDQITKLSDLKSKVTLLADNVHTSSSFVMAGNVNKNLASQTETVTIDVKRMASKIVIAKIENQMILPAYQQDGDVKINGAYLMNVTGKQKFGNLDAVGTREYLASANIDTWFGKNTKETGNALLTEAYSSPKAINYTKNITDVSTFYAYPNDAEFSEASTWSNRATVLVVEATVDGTACVYPIQLPNLESNKLYSISLVIKHMGGDPSKPWEKIKFDDMTPEIVVTDWIPAQEGGYTETI